MTREPPERHPNHREVASLPPELRRTTVPDAVRAWVRAVTGRRVERIRRLPGASSSAVHGLRLEGGLRLVLRRYLWRGFLEGEPDAPRREVDALIFAHGQGLPVPEVIGADVDGQATGDGVPALLMTFLPGRALAAPDLTRLAEVAAGIHAVGSGPAGHRYFRWYDPWSVQPPPNARRPELWEAAITRWQGALPPFTPGLTHRDFHPGNVLWARGRSTGVVDWANACEGPAGCDVAHCRWNLIELSGVEAADAFLAAYEAVSGTDYDPFWELGSVLEHGASAWAGPAAAQAERRLEPALAALGLL
jgi:aminoglycoside phosphotransferase (APT) family kinase protein